MKKFFLSGLFMCFSLSLLAQSEFPYSKMLSMTQEELKEAKFKYDHEWNQYVLRKSNGLKVAENVLNALSGTTADIKPHEDDYTVVIQYGDEGIAKVIVKFYKDATYHDLMTFARDNGVDILETNSGKLNKLQYNYGGYSFELNMQANIIQTTTTNTSALAKTKDESYNTYTYIIYTGKEPNSPGLRKEMEKQEKRDQKGRKKQSISDLM